MKKINKGRLLEGYRFESLSGLKNSVTLKVLIPWIFVVTKYPTNGIPDKEKGVSNDINDTF